MAAGRDGLVGDKAIVFRQPVGERFYRHDAQGSGKGAADPQGAAGDGRGIWDDVRSWSNSFQRLTRRSHETGRTWTRCSPKINRADHSSPKEKGRNITLSEVLAALGGRRNPRAGAIENAMDLAGIR